jgi:hypothetical protein
MQRFSIQKGFNQVQRKDLCEMKMNIMQILGIKSRAQWNNYLRGDVEPKFSHAKEIELLFINYGINDIYEEV